MISSRVSLLENGTVVPVRLRLANKAIARGTDAELAPVLLEQTEVGCILGLGVAIGIMGSVHILTMID
jgi:hypothetical protein